MALSFPPASSMKCFLLASRKLKKVVTERLPAFPPSSGGGVGASDEPPSSFAAFPLSFEGWVGASSPLPLLTPPPGAPPLGASPP